MSTKSVLTVKLVRHQQSWAKKFERERRRVEKRLGKRVLAIEHVGSTAIPGIPAKPVIDIAVGVRSMKSSKRLVLQFERLGYALLPDFGGPSIHLLLVRGPDKERTHHIHLLKYKGVIWNNLVGFRDYLIAHPREAERYVALKRRLAKKYPNRRGAYTRAKGAFVHSIFRKLSK